MKVILWLICLVCVLLIAGCTSTGGSEITTTEGIKIGDTVEAVSRAENILCATTQDNYKLLYKYLVAEDKMGVEEMYKKGQVFLLKSGTKVKIIQTTFNGTEVRVQEGEHRGKIAWIARDFLKR